MKLFYKTIFILKFLLIGMALQAQPYSLKKEIKPEGLQLLEDKRKGHEGEKSIVYVGVVSDSANYHFIKGYDMYQLVDVLVANFESDESLKVEIAGNTWEDIKDSKSTGSSKDGIANFKFKDYGSAGIIVHPPKSGKAKYIITAIASPPKKEHLGSPFKKIDESELTVNNEERKDSSSSNNIWLYIVLGIAFLVIGLLGGKLLSKNKSTTVIVLFLTFSFSVSAQRGTSGVPEESLDLLEEMQQQDQNDSQEARDFRSNVAQNLVGKLDQIRSVWNAINDFDRAYSSFRNCVPTTPPIGEPIMPSFCDIPTTEIGFEDNSNCAGCFLNARQGFNETRYKLEQLAAIYKCTKTYSTAAISLGDNASGVHAVTGIVWQQERAKIMTTVQNLEIEYDKTYAFLMQELRDKMMELNLCEEQYGVEDWFDRFGFMYFEFMQEKYRRAD